MHVFIYYTCKFHKKHQVSYISADWISLYFSPSFGKSWNCKQIVSTKKCMTLTCEICFNFAVLLHSRLTSDKHISSIVASSFFQLCFLLKIKHFLTEKTVEIAVHTFITSCLQFLVLRYIFNSQVARLQLVQRASTRFLKKGHKNNNAAPILD